MQPRRAHAKERFFIEVTFEAPLPEGALPLAEFAGPIGPGGPALTFWSTSTGPVEGYGRNRMTHLEIRWGADMPLSWVPATVPLDALGGDVLIQVEPTAARTQPEIPRLIEAG
jgi:hypothetical protein